MNNILSLLFASLFCFGMVKEGVIIENIDVGGLPYAQAETILREKLYQGFEPFVVHTPSGDMYAEGLSVTDNIPYLVRKAKKGETLSVTYFRQWTEMEHDLLKLCKKNSREAKDAEVSFSADGFTFTHEVTGIACDYQGLMQDVTEALLSGRNEAVLNCREYAPEITEERLKERTQKLASFTTIFDEGNEPRRHNIALAASRISGMEIEAGGEFSFNRAVGERTEKNGFKVAAVIEGGQFVPGVGGGVCQASTTLFGAALRAGLKITESHAHSLSVGYVPPSLDAMVSSASDLKFVNPYPFPVYLSGRTDGGAVTFTVYGKPDGLRYETESVVLSRITPPEPEIVEDEGLVRAEKEGLKSESFLLVYDGAGSLVSRTRIRKDCYAAMRGKIIPPAIEIPEETEKISETP